MSKLSYCEHCCTIIDSEKDRKILSPCSHCIARMFSQDQLIDNDDMKGGEHDRRLSNSPA